MSQFLLLAAIFIGGGLLSKMRQAPGVGLQRFAPRKGATRGEGDAWLVRMIDLGVITTWFC